MALGPLIRGFSRLLRRDFVGVAAVQGAQTHNNAIGMHIYTDSLTTKHIDDVVDGFSSSAVRDSFLQLGHWFERLMGLLLFGFATRLLYSL